jgi:hypothetical protein
MSGWDRASPGYLAEWLPHFTPYESDLASELGLREGDHVLSTAGSEVLALARAVGETGHVDAFDASDDVVVLCRERVEAAGLGARITCTHAPPNGPYEAAASAFALVHASDAVEHVRNLGDRIAPAGKVGVIVWGPPVDGDPERAFAKIVDELHPEIHAAHEPTGLDRAALSTLFEKAGLALVRHTIVSHTLVFQRAERFAMSLLGARTYGPELVALGEEAVGAALARFYERVVAQDAPISYSPVATIVIGAHHGAEVELPHRPSVRVPT